MNPVPAPAEPAALDAAGLARFLPALPGWPWPGLTPALTIIPGGRTNRTWRMQLEPGADWFVKIPGPHTGYIDRGVAHAALRQAAGLGLAPQVAYFDPASGIEVTEFLAAYHSATEGELCRTDRLVEIADLHRRFHATALLPATKTIFEMIDEHLEQLAQLALALPPWVQGILARWRPAQQAFVASGIDLVPSHNDGNPLNYMVAEGLPLKIIDFDYASNNERCYEIGSLTQGYLVETADRAAMLEAYFGRMEPALDARVRIAGLACDIKWALWSLMNAQVLDVDFDFAKFAMGKLVNAERTMAHPGFERWIEAL
ncbi:MAG TPA: phosphotransferase [Rubrivivax sp.]|nr:phosphotransferase [Rubrivivax sp.]